MSIDGRFQHRLGDFRLDADFSLPEQGVTGILGPSGAGKTTLLRAMAGLDRTDVGVLRFADATWQDESTFLPPHRRKVGYVFQEPSLFGHLDVEGNLRFAERRGGRRSPARSRRELVAMLGLDGLLHRDTRSLSGGERRRVAIARALAAAPRWLLLDEPMAGLDRERRDALLPWLDTLRRELEIPVVLVSHDIGDVERLADHVMLMDDGRVAACGPIQQVATDLELPMARLRDAATVVQARVQSYDEQWKLARLSCSGGELLAPGDALSGRDAVRVRIAARDVSLALDRPINTSILNILEATIDLIHEDGDGQAIVRLRCGEDAILSRVTRRSVADLGLAAGARVFIQVKSLALLT